MSDANPVVYSREDGIVTITIDRPERKNALSIEAMNALTDAWERVEKDMQARVVILTSTDCGVFSAGLDLKQASEIRARDGVDILTLMRDPLQTAMRKVSKPIIAAMTGSLMAGGMLLAIKSDLRIGLRGTRAGITEVKMGRGSPWAVPLLWMLPQSLVMELVITGETMPIERLAEHGFVNYLEDTPDAVRARALQLARGIVEGAPLSVSAAKASLLAAMDLGCAEGLLEANRLHVQAYASEDAIEGPKAFSEKRKPVWQGK
ncbi:enoyl-CoA hydratase/isomerase family protein [Tardiphaga sp.]|jgi:enoyl-CoA hydratase|uniref:enoyl-CoA hydratase/isomerase family protein n=1 Tax=Tardiphaga sp. TaxID=1926292 RepID=UPI0037DA4050